eukprot:2132251-Rhodomonas_salina.2
MAKVQPLASHGPTTGTKASFFVSSAQHSNGYPGYPWYPSTRGTPSKETARRNGQDIANFIPGMGITYNFDRLISQRVKSFWLLVLVGIPTTFQKKRQCLLPDPVQSCQSEPCFVAEHDGLKRQYRAPG